MAVHPSKYEFPRVEVKVDHRGKILGEVDDARDEQVENLGEYRYSDEQWVAVLGEEFGALCGPIMSGPPSDVREALVQLAATTVAWLEDMDGRLCGPVVSSREPIICEVCKGGWHPSCQGSPCECGSEKHEKTGVPSWRDLYYGKCEKVADLEQRLRTTEAARDAFKNAAKELDTRLQEKELKCEQANAEVLFENTLVISAEDAEKVLADYLSQMVQWDAAVTEDSRKPCDRCREGIHRLCTGCACQCVLKETRGCSQGAFKDAFMKTIQCPQKEPHLVHDWKWTASGAYAHCCGLKAPRVDGFGFPEELLAERVGPNTCPGPEAGRTPEYHTFKCGSGGDAECFFCPMTRNMLYAASRVAARADAEQAYQRLKKHAEEDLAQTAFANGFNGVANGGPDVITVEGLQCPFEGPHGSHSWRRSHWRDFRRCPGVVEPEEQPMSCCGALPSAHLCRGVCP